MKKLVYTFSLLGALAVGANADVTKDTDNCYMIGTPSQLLEFAGIVNAATEPDPELCGKLTANIEFNPTTLLNENMTGFATGNAAESNNWTPMENFYGTFNGQGYSISGIYYGHTASKDDEDKDIIQWPDKAGLFINLGDGATVKNLRIVDSYFGASLRVGSIAAEVSGTGVTIDRSSFAGLVSTINRNARPQDNQTKEYLQANVFIGGLIGTIIENASLTITSSITMGNILPGTSGTYGGDIQRGGVVGLAQSGSSIRIENTHGIGLVHNQNQYSITKTALKGTWSSDDRVFCAGSGSVCNKRYCNLAEESEINDIIATCEREYMKDLVGSIGFKGVSLEYGTRDDGRKIVIAHITENDTTRNDNVLQELVIPEDFPVDSVDFDRPFSGKSSTVMIPFDIAAANVMNYNGDNVLLGSVESISCENDEVKVCTATATNAQAQIEAHTPYLVSTFTVDQDMDPIGDIPVGQTIHFHGPVVLKKNEATEYSANVGANWSLVGTYKTLITTSKDDASAESDYEKVSMLGKIFGFVGTAGVSDGEGDNKHDFTLGEFARAGHNVRTREMRSYLIYTPPTVVPSLAPSISGMQRAAAPTAETELPASIPVTFKTRSIISVPAFVDTTVKPTTMVQVIMPTFSDDECESPDGECEEGTTAIAKPFVTPFKSNKIDRWQDAMGRNLNGKPTKHGTYFKNGIPVIIK